MFTKQENLRQASGMDFPKRRLPAENRFLEQALEELQAAKFRVTWHPSRYLKESGDPCGATRQKTISIAVLNRLWFRTFVHEYAHFQQTREGLWNSEQDWLLWGVWEWWMDYAYKRDPSDEKLLRACRTIQDCELDAEKRVVRLAKQYHLDSINLPRYIQGANAYILSYEASRLTRTYCKSGEAASSSKFLKTVPQHFLRRFPSGYFETYLADCSPRKLRMHMGSAVDV